MSRCSYADDGCRDATRRPRRKLWRGRRKVAMLLQCSAVGYGGVRRCSVDGDGCCGTTADCSGAGGCFVGGGNETQEREQARKSAAMEEIRWEESERYVGHRGTRGWNARRFARWRNQPLDLERFPCMNGYNLYNISRSGKVRTSKWEKKLKESLYNVISSSLIHL